ncbi:MAG: DUF86 domain-containing protein [Victivallaceae bacterium]|nr:DUF86 domain-containing protein [Victivallaceae bacterium]
MNSDLERLDHILNSISKIEKSLLVTYEEYLDSDDKKAALFAHTAIIGEAASKLSKELRQQYPDVPWKSAVSLRNILVHDYIRVDYTILWDTAKHDLPLLKQQIQRILDNLQ